MPAPDALLELCEVLRALKEEAVRTPQIAIPYDSWSDYRRHQEMWNPGYSRAGELDGPV